ncbi:MAG: integrase [Hyphomicrobium sp.]|nr:MAG: integrase [Hyphomicrobium sp.]
MDRNDILGGNPLGVLVRLVVLSIVVGIVLSAFGITPANFFYNINIIARRIYDMGFGAVEWGLQYLALGAMVVVPIWLIARLVGLGRRSRDDR